MIDTSFYKRKERISITDAGVFAHYPQSRIVQIPTRDKLLNALSFINVLSCTNTLVT